MFPRKLKEKVNGVISVYEDVALMTMSQFIKKSVCRKCFPILLQKKQSYYLHLPKV